MDVQKKSVSEKTGYSEIKIYSAFLLDDETIKNIESRFLKMGYKARFSFVIDPSLIGGIIVKIGDTLYDGSIKSELEKIKECIMDE